MCGPEHGQDTRVEYLRSTSRRNIRFTVGLCCAAAWLTPLATTRAQPEREQIIKAVEFAGLIRTSEVYVRDMVRVRPGDTLDTTVLDEAVTRLLRTGRFLSVTYDLTEDGDGVRVTFELREHPVVSAIRFEGNKKFGDGRLKEQVAQKVGSPVDWLAVRNGREAIIAMYRDAGYGDVTVAYDQERLQRLGELVYTVEEGKQVRIHQIVFEGNEAFPDRELKRNIDTKTAFWILRAGAFDEEKAETDVARLQTYYRDHGFLDAGELSPRAQ